jgi:hypothetical protein
MLARLNVYWLVGLALCVGGRLHAAEPDQGDNESAIAKQTQNPGAVLASVPFQFNFNGNLGSYDRTQMLLNIQPVLPAELTPELSIISRWVVPVISQPDTTSPTGSTFGVGDFNPQIFLAANLPNGLTYGAGASLILPTATDARLGQGKLALGPTLLAAYSGGPLVAGALLIADFSVGGDPTRRSVGFLTAQPFANFNFPSGIYFVTAPVIERDWKQGQWTAPVGGGFGRIFVFDRTPVNINAQGYWNAASPSGGPEWQFRFVIQFVYPQPKSAAGKQSGAA